MSALLSTLDRMFQPNEDFLEITRNNTYLVSIVSNNKNKFRLHQSSTLQRQNKQD